MHYFGNRRVIAALLLMTAIALLLVPSADFFGRSMTSSTSLTAVEDDATFCPGGEVVRIGDERFCTHGPDPVPAGLPRFGGISRAVAAAVPRVACDGNGRSGSRVQVIYARPQGVAERPNWLIETRTFAAQTDEIYRNAAIATGGDRRIRFVTTPQCEVDVIKVVLSPATTLSWSEMAAELYRLGYDRANRKYLVFYDPGYDHGMFCGVAGIEMDARISRDNLNVSGPDYARVDERCWYRAAMVASHELMHMIGGVQMSALNSSGGFHCIDEWDILCYADQRNGTYPTMRFDCPSVEGNLTVLDCAAEGTEPDDYFHAAPTPGSYLSQCWNPANSPFLIGAATLPTPGPTPVICGREPNMPPTATPTPDLSPPVITNISPNGKTTRRPGERVRITVEVRDRQSGVGSVEIRACGEPGCTWETAVVVGTLTEKPWGTTWAVPSRGKWLFLVRATNDDGAESAVVSSSEFRAGGR